jgi:hypothetical protein
MQVLYGLSIKADRKAVLDKLRQNRAEHSKIVKEARKAYVEMAKKAVEKKLAALAEGKVVSLSFKLSAPLDYTTVYDTAIRALELHTEPTIELSSEQVRNLVDDTWDWSGQFTSSNMLYSDTLRKKFENFDPEENE